MQVRSCARLTFALAMLLLGTSAAHAAVLLTSSRTVSPFSFVFAPGGSSTVSVPLNDAGATSLSFTTPAAQTVVVTFSAECSGNTAGTSVIATVFIDGVIANGEFGTHFTRVCAGGQPIEVMSRTVFKSVPAGSHTIQVRAWIDGPPFVFYTGQFDHIVLAVVN